MLPELPGTAVQYIKVDYAGNKGHLLMNRVPV